MDTEKTIFQILTEAGCEIDSNASDLFVKATPEARKLVLDWQKAKKAEWGLGFGPVVLTFWSEGEEWLDLPFLFDPFWEAKGMTA